VLLALICLIVGFSSGFLVRELISRRRRESERRRRYSVSEIEKAPVSVERRLEPLGENEKPLWGVAK
jgi:hypothetical protein